MITREEALKFGLSFDNVYEERPFRDQNWQVVRAKENKKIFLWIYDRNGYVNLNVKVDPQWRDFWRSTYEAVTAGYHQNKEHWNTIILDGSIPEEDVKKMIDDRQQEIVGQYAEAERRRQEAEQAKLAYDQEIAQAKQKRDEIVREAAELARRQERDILNAAREEAKAITAKAHSDIRQERRKVFNEMKTEISDIAIEIAEKVTEKEIDSDKHRELIDSFIDQIGEAS